MKKTFEQILLAEIEEFIASPAWYGHEAADHLPCAFGQQACKNSKLIERLRAGGKCFVPTAEKVREFMEMHRRAESRKPKSRTPVRVERNRQTRTAA